MGLREWLGLSDNIVAPQAPVAVIEDKIPEVKVSIPDTSPVALMPNIRNPVVGYHDSRQSGRGAFLPAEYDLSEMGRVEDTDSYVRQAFDKKTALMFKEGWDLVGKNPRTIKYVKARLAQIAAASGLPTNTLFRNLGGNIVRKSNAFLAKVRKTDASGGRVRVLPNGTKLKPVAAYFPIPAESLEFQLTGSGTKISKWQQKMPNASAYQVYNTKNIIHIWAARKDGFIFGTPCLIPVIDDVRALRKIEENIELLVYQHLFPLFQYKVGTKEMPAGLTEDGRREIDVVRQEIQFMPSEGGIVTPFRHDITAIGVEGRALRAESYLDHFKNRVFSGLGVSAVDMGEGDTANRATADNMSRNLVDAVKDLQQVLEDAINDEIIKELLLESTFGTSVLDEENIVRLEFKEIDIEAQLKKETHAADLFSKDVLEHDETRARLGLEPWIIPTPEEVEAQMDNPELFPQWHKSRWKMFDLPKMLIQAVDEPFSPAAKAAAADSSLPMTTSGNEEATKTGQEQELELERERGKQKRTAVKNGFLQSTFAQTKKDVIKRVTEKKTIDHDWVAAIIRAELGTTINRLFSDQIISFRKGYSSIASVQSEQFVQSTAIARIHLKERAEHFVIKLTENVVSSLRRNVKVDSDDIVGKTRAVFEAVEFRTSFIEDVEIRKAKSLGIALAVRDTGSNVNLASFSTRDEACAGCSGRSGNVINLAYVDVDDLPPHHANCHCNLGEVQASLAFTDSIKDGLEEVIEEPDESERIDKPLPEQENLVATCPECGKTATKTKDTINTFSCMACGATFAKFKDDEEEGE